MTNTELLEAKEKLEKKVLALQRKAKKVDETQRRVTGQLYTLVAELRQTITAGKKDLLWYSNHVREKDTVIRRMHRLLSKKNKEIATLKARLLDFIDNTGKLKP